MIARRSGPPPLATVGWTPQARRSLARLLRFLRQNEYGDPEARGIEIEQAIEKLRYAPLRCAVVAMRCGRSYRKLTVGKFLVYYVYLPARGLETNGTLSIRAVKHGGGARPFAGVREISFEELRA
jgi:plasmid stabilization system protein ParE